ncbi:MAG: hypothetical protein ACLPVF_07000 [Acidimicrobiales bacterium]
MASGLLAACTTTPAPAPEAFTVPRAVVPAPSSVPAPYRPLVAVLEARIAGLRSRSAGLAAKGHTVFGAEVLLANGNRGPALLGPQAVTQATLEVERFHQLGIGGIMLEITFPLLLPSFPDHAAYLAFYEHVVAAARARHMEVTVEENPVFPGFSAVVANYSGLTLQTYAAEQRQMAQVIIDHLRPTYLTILDETDTFSAHLGLTLDTPAAAVAVVQRELSGLDRRTTKIGAGAGTWEDPAIDRALATETSIDYVSVHVLPIDARTIDNLVTDVRIAQRAEKSIVMDETWLYKDVTPGVQGLLADNAVTGLNGFSFFAPLDQDFLDAVTAFARTHGIAFVSPSWSGQLFAYLTWNPSLDRLSPTALRARAAAVQAVAMNDHTYSSTGRAYGRLAARGA